jgi:hypothetical protein
VAVAGTVTDGCVLTTAYDAFFRQLPVVLIEDAIGACGDGPHMSAILSMANWLYGSRIMSASALAGWLSGGQFEGWKWTRGNEFPYTVDSLRSDYERLVGRSLVSANP